jgi:ribosome-binding factor A
MKKTNNDGRRKIRVEREVQQVISAFIINHLRNDLPGLVTVMRVQMPADFRAAQVFVTYFNSEQPEQNEKSVNVAKILQSWAKDIQDEIVGKLKMRYCPKVTFFNDETTGNILKIEKILSNLSSGQKVAAIDDDELDEDELDEDYDEETN